MKGNQAPRNIFGDLRILWKYDDAAMQQNVYAQVFAWCHVSWKNGV
jgi:hypothetical protein